MLFPLILLAFAPLAPADDAKTVRTAPSRDLARLYADTGRESSAIRVAMDVLAANPNDAETALLLARLHVSVKEYREAIAVLEAIKTQPFRTTSLRKLAEVHDLAGDRPAAAKAWQSLLETLADSPEKAEALEQLGRVQNEPQSTASFEQAATLFRKFDQPHAAARLDWNLAQSADAKKALESIKRFLATKPAGVAPYRRYAELLRQQGPPGNAEQVLETLATQEPGIEAIRWVLNAERARRDFPSAHVRFQEFAANTVSEEFFELLVATYAEQNRAAELCVLAEDLFPVPPEKSVAVPLAQSQRQQALVRALGQRPELAAPLLAAFRNGRTRSPQLWELLAWLADRADKPEDYERALRQSLALAGGDASSPAFDRLATHLARHRKWNELLALTRPTQNFEPYLAILRSEALAELGRGDEALRLLKSQKLASFAMARNRARILGMMSRYDDMLALLNEMLKEYKSPIEAKGIRYLRAEAFLGQDRLDLMEAELRGILYDDPDDVLALNNLGYNLADRNRKLPEAEALIRRALEVDHHIRVKAGDVHLASAAYLDSLGWVLFRRGDLKNSRKHLELASEQSEGKADAIVWDHLGDVCFRLGDKPAALKAWTNAAERFQSDHRGKQQGRADELAKKLKLVK